MAGAPTAARGGPAFSSFFVHPLTQRQMIPQPHDSLEALRQVLRKYGMGVIGISCFTLLSGGLAVLTSILSIVLGVWIFTLAQTRTTLLLAIQSEMQTPQRGCCSCSGALGPIRGISIAIITLAVITLLVYVPLFSILGSINTTTRYTCYTNGSGTCSIYWYAPGGTSYYVPVRPPRTPFLPQGCARPAPHPPPPRHFKTCSAIPGATRRALSTCLATIMTRFLPGCSTWWATRPSPRRCKSPLAQSR